MGGTTYDYDDYSARSTARSLKGTPVFAHSAAVHSGATAARVHKTLDPYGVKMREARDSEAHPISIPIGIILDTTGSMQQVPGIIQRELNRLMGMFLDAKASGKKYLGEGYPAILIGAVDDYFAMLGENDQGNGALQVGQFESGIEIDDNLTNLWLTGNGGGNSGESYDAALYFFARHTVHDHWEKRGLPGYLFIIGDEPHFDHISSEMVERVMGDKLRVDIPSADTVGKVRERSYNIPIAEIVGEVQERYHTYYVMPRLTSHWGDKRVEDQWKKTLGEEHFLRLEDPNAICELIASTVAANEGLVTVADMETDGVSSAVTKALTVVGKGVPSRKTSTGNLPSVAKARPAARL